MRGGADIGHLSKAIALDPDGMPAAFFAEQRKSSNAVLVSCRSRRQLWDERHRHRAECLYTIAKGDTTWHPKSQ
jgi:hypothetical protein